MLNICKFCIKLIREGEEGMKRKLLAMFLCLTLVATAAAVCKKSEQTSGDNGNDKLIVGFAQIG